MVIEISENNIKKPSIVALIPARSGSLRVPGKNIRYILGHPLIAYTITAALNSGIFSKVIVSTDSTEYSEIAMYYGAEVPFLRPESISGAYSPDIEFVEHAISELNGMGVQFDCFSILRPTSPFRKPNTIRRAWDEFLSHEGIDSLRAVEKCNEHPGKMWVIRGDRMYPFISFGPEDQPWHSSQYQTLPEIYVQNASLEIAWTKVVNETRTIAGNTIIPFLTVDDEGLDINGEYDWKVVTTMLEGGQAILPVIDVEPYMKA
jgi:N-acylneuraminate cytidylyltransferase